MIDYLCTFFLYLFSFIYTRPLIISLKKKTIMDSCVDKTFDYYFDNLTISPLDTEYIIKYRYNFYTYFLVCEYDNIDKAEIYIKNINSQNLKKILGAYIEEADRYRKINDIQAFAGPNSDFYKNTFFHLKKSFITDKPFVIVNNRLEIFKQDDEKIKF